MSSTTIAHPARKAVDEEARREVWRTVLRESEARYRHELMADEERELLWDRIIRLRRRLGLS